MVPEAMLKTLAPLWIDALELSAILFRQQSDYNTKYKHMWIRTDNTVAIAYIKNMGGTQSEYCLKR